MHKTIITSVFETIRGNYEELLQVFTYSARLHMPDADLVVVRDIPKRAGRSNAYNAMTARLDSWVPVVLNTPGDIILCDVDLIFRDDLFKVFAEYEFDVAYTGRKSRSKPINGGLVFIRDGSQRFTRTWARVNRRMFRDGKFHARWRKKCRGMNQSALWYLIYRQKYHNYKMLELPCAVYNACDQEWASMPDDVQVIHLKRALRRTLDGRGKMPAGAERAIAMWREYEEASRCEK